MTVQIGDVIDGKYEIMRLLGEGGMGAVYEGNNTRIHRRVAIKVLHAEVANNEEAMTRFEREAQAAGRIGSEHIVEVLDLGDLPGGERYMVMEFLEGEALNDRIEKGQMDARAIAALMVDMLEGLDAAHAAGIIHRDLKPDNVFLCANRSGKQDFVKIVDFGISKFNTLGGEFSMTRTGAVMGTPYYMAPEQAKGGDSLDHRVDLYASGVILYQAVVGQVPFDGETFNELLFKIVLETPKPIEEAVPGIDPSFAQLVNKAMAREPDARFQTAKEFQAALTSWLGGGYVQAGQTMSGGTPALDKTQLPTAGVSMATPGAGVSVARGSVADVEEEEPVGLPTKSGGAGVKIGIAVAVIVAGGLGAVLMSGGSEEEAERQAKQEELELERKKLDAERAAALEELQAEKAAAEEARAQAEEARESAEANKDALKAKAAEEAAARAVADEKAAAAAASRPVRRPAPRPRPAPAPAPAPKPAPTSGGRPIRVDL